VIELAILLGWWIYRTGPAAVEARERRQRHLDLPEQVPRARVAFIMPSACR
jgi:hypothetical protein